jgi:hypothetical protein
MTSSNDDDIPSDLLLNFFRKATDTLWNVQPEKGLGAVVASHSHHRSRLLDIQKHCLQCVIEEYNHENHTDFSVEQVQEKLARLGKRQQGDDDVMNESMQASNDAARCAFARLVLYDEVMYEQRKESLLESRRLRMLETDEPFGKAELSSYASLCYAAVKLPEVQRYWTADGSSSSPLFGDETTTLRNSPQERLQHIQELLMRAVGFEPGHGKRELERLMLSDIEKELQEIILQLNSNMSAAFQNVQLNSQAELLSDQEKGGVTRVVSVSYSEKVVDATGQEISSTNTAPKAESMHQQQAEGRQRAQLDMARQAAALQQSILQDLMALDKEEREKQLQEAERAHYEFLQKVSQVPSGPERVAFLTSMDGKTQKLLATHKLWMSTQQK